MKLLRIVLLWAAVVVAWGLQPVAAQDFHRGARKLVKKGRMERPDSVRMRRDSVERLLMRDSLLAARFAQDTLRTAADSLRRERTIDSLVSARLSADSLGVRSSLHRDSLQGADRAIDSLTGRAMQDSLAQDSLPKKKRGWLMSDSMSLSKVCWMSTILPGYGQIYNKQYWKLPVLYGLVGSSLAMYFHENKTYKPLKRAYDAYTATSVDRTPELDALQHKMIRSNTRRQIYLGAAIASYIYFIGDAAVSYKTNDVSRVKKATTLACIFPGAGQIYNKSYWKVPFVVGGFASMVYCIDWNNRGYKRFKKAYGLLADYERNPDKYQIGRAHV